MPILALIGGFLTKFLTDRLLYFAALKVLLVALIVTILPIVLKNVFTWIMDSMMSLVNSNIIGLDPSIQDFVIQLTGVGAYLGGQFQVVLCLQILLTAIVVRLTLKCIPLLGF